LRTESACRSRIHPPLLPDRRPQNKALTPQHGRGPPPAGVARKPSCHVTSAGGASNAPCSCLRRAFPQPVANPRSGRGVTASSHVLSAKHEVWSARMRIAKQRPR
jgi:hypothetical protein